MNHTIAVKKSFCLFLVGLVYVISVFLVQPATAVAEDPSATAIIAQIRQQYAGINGLILTNRKIFASIVSKHRPDKGMLIDGFYKDGVLQKAVSHDYAEMLGHVEMSGHVETEYYFQRGHPFFVYRISRQYQRREP